jgi:hypothetical protein
VEPLDGVVPPLDGVVELLAVVLVLVVDVVFVFAAAAAVLDATAWLGTVNGGTPAVLAVEGPPPPQAARPTPRAMATTTARMNLDRRARG